MAGSGYVWDRRDDPVVNLVDAPSDAVVLSGMLHAPGLRRRQDVAQVWAGPRVVFEYPMRFLPAIYHLSVLRPLEQVRPWFSAAGFDPRFVDTMLAGGQLARVTTTDGGRDLRVTPAVRLQRTCLPVGRRGSAVLLSPHRKVLRERLAVHDVTAALLFSRGYATLPVEVALARYTRRHRGTLGAHSRQFAADLPALVAGRYAHLAAQVSQEQARQLRLARRDR